ncbi:MAG: ATP-dependent 6-phosphofructokinase [Methylacidiphilales bacterium]|nr:ATP-dependent 6-phosphofructokinase [Candidatus Methylacidiphilales bacterium]
MLDVAGGGVVAFAEACGEYEDFLHGGSDRGGGGFRQAWGEVGVGVKFLVGGVEDGLRVEACLLGEGGMSMRIGILTSGGDCPGLNAVIQSAVYSAHRLGWETIGFIDGYEGLLRPVRYKVLTPENTRRIMSTGGTIIGTTNKGRFVAKVGHGERAKVPAEVIAEAKQTLRDLGVDALIAVGGDGSLTTAQQLFEEGVPVVGVPKTIDNDISATAMTFGFDSAVECVMRALDSLQTTAASHKRVMIVEAMGRYAGWIALYGGIAGGADIILIPEIPFSYEKIFRDVRDRLDAGAEYIMMVVAEGAKPIGGDYVTRSMRGCGEARLGGISQVIAEAIQENTGREARAVVLGHLQRGGNPTTFDRILGTRFGCAAVKLIREGKFGRMVSYLNYMIGDVSIAEAVGQLKLVPVDHQMVQMARDLGVSFGD